MRWWEKVGAKMLGGVIEQRVQEAIKVVDDAWWRQVGGAAGGPGERPWTQRRKELDAALEAWRAHPLARRIVSLTSDYVLGDGLIVSAEPPAAAAWAQRFWEHPQNRMAERLPAWCDELTRAGELFIVLSRNPADGMSYVRLLPASQIDQIETDPDDIERERRYHEIGEGLLDGRWWPAAGASEADEDQALLHVAVNRPAGCLRGVGDLTPILPWLEHYARWLEDRVRVNRLKSAFVWQVTLRGATPALVAQKRAQYGRPPAPGSVIISNEGEKWEAIQPRIDAEAVEADGKAIRLMAAAGAGVPLHFLSEGESATRATAQEMGDPTFRRYRRRQMELCRMMETLLAVAYGRAGGLMGLEGAARFTVRAPEIVRSDNETLGRAAQAMTEALGQMRERGWIDDARAARLALKAAGEEG